MTAVGLAGQNESSYRFGFCPAARRRVLTMPARHWPGILPGSPRYRRQILIR